MIPIFWFILKIKSSIFHNSSIQLLKGTERPFITSKNLSEYYAVVTKGITPLLSSTEALADIYELISFFEVLYPNPRSYQKLFELITQYKPKGLMIHDMEIASIGLVNDISKIATFNRADFQQIAGIDVVTPSA